MNDCRDRAPASGGNPRLEFYYALNNNVVSEERFSMEDIFSVYAFTCNLDAPLPGMFDGCGHKYVSWVGSPGDLTAVPTVQPHMNLIGGVKKRFGEDSTKSKAFIRDGRDYGVSNEL
jgi:hypothetical protein